MSQHLAKKSVTESQNNKATTVNEMVGQLDQSLAGIYTVDFTPGDVDLSAVDDVDNRKAFLAFLILRSSNMSAPQTLTLPALQRGMFIVDNPEAHAVTVTIGATSEAVAAGQNLLFMADGTTNGLTVLGGVGAGGTFISLADTPLAYSGHTGKVLAVNGAEDALEFVDPDAGSGPTAAIYWRVRTMDNNGDATYISIAELEWLDVDGHRIDGIAATVADDELSGSWVASNATDGNRDTAWLVGTPTSEHWVRSNWGVAQAVYGLRMLGRSAAITQAPTEFYVESSPNGTTWTEEFYVTGITGWAADTWKEWTWATGDESVPEGVSAQHWRLTLNANSGDGSYTGLSTVSFREAVGGPEINNKYAISTSASSTALGSSDETLDGNVDTRWLAANASVPASITYDFGEAVVVSELALAIEAATGRAPSEFDVSYSSDGVNFTILKSFTGISAWTYGVEKTFTVQDGAVANLLESFTVATLPSVLPAGRMIYVSDETGGAVPAFSDGVNFRRSTDRAVVS